MYGDKLIPGQAAAGQAVQDSTLRMNGYEGELAASKQNVASFRSKQEGYRTELSMLQAREEAGDDLPASLRIKMIDLSVDIKELDGNISRAGSGDMEIQHNIDLSRISVQKAKDNYQSIVAPAGSGNLSKADIDFLKTHKPRTKLSTSEREALIGRYGMQAYNDHVPLL